MSTFSRKALVGLAGSGLLPAPLPPTNALLTVVNTPFSGTSGSLVDSAGHRIANICAASLQRFELIKRIANTCVASLQRFELIKRIANTCVASLQRFELIKRIANTCVALLQRSELIKSGDSSDGAD